jgi:hypothetical protein
LAEKKFGKDSSSDDPARDKKMVEGLTKKFLKAGNDVINQEIEQHGFENVPLAVLGGILSAVATSIMTSGFVAAHETIGVDMASGWLEGTVADVVHNIKTNTGVEYQITFVRKDKT